MSVFGALSSAVSGIQAQGTAIGIISDNISNVNTVGYKAGSQVFSTLVTSSGSTVAYSPGGVRAQNRQLVDQQGLVQTTNSPLDVAISGDGFFVVSDDAGGLSNSGTIAYTRAGSFRTDSLGNFVNTAGQFLQAWPVDGEGRLPGADGNANTTLSSLLESLETVNIGSASGDASATTLVEVGLNLNASQDVFRGASDIGTPGTDSANVENRGIRSDELFVPNANVAVGDTITVEPGGDGNPYTFTYGGFAQSFDVIAANGGDGILGANTLTDRFDTGVTNGDTFTISRTDDSANPITFTFTTTSSPNTSAGFFNSMTTLAEAIDRAAGLVARVETVGGAARLFVSATDANQGLNMSAGPGSTANFPTSLGLVADANLGFQRSVDAVATGIYGANDATTEFVGPADGNTFTLETSSSGGPVSFTFRTPAAPNTAAGVGEFDNLTTLADAINNNANFQASIDTSGGEIRLRVASVNAGQTVTITDGLGAAGFPAALGLTAYPSTTSTESVQSAAVASVSNRWNTLDGLAQIVNDGTLQELGAEIINGNTSSAGIQIFNTNPLTDLTFTDSDPADAVLTELGITNAAIGATYSSGATATNSMASGNTSPHFERGIRVFDSLGVGHDIRVGFLKTGLNTWFAEIYVLDDAEITDPGRQIAAGEIEFNGDGSLLSIDDALVSNVTANWSNESQPSLMTFDFGTAGTAGSTTPGDTDGLRQFSGPYNVDFINQNGAPVGLLDSVSIDEEGFITANFNNGQTKVLYKIPLADFANPNGLNALTGNVFTQTFGSGEVNLKEVGDGGVGAISPSSLESSNAELAGALTDMIVAQRAYQASARVITTADELLDELSRI